MRSYRGFPFTQSCHLSHPIQYAAAASTIRVVWKDSIQAVVYFICVLSFVYCSKGQNGGNCIGSSSTSIHPKTRYTTQLHYMCTMIRIVSFNLAVAA